MLFNTAKTQKSAKTQKNAKNDAACSTIFIFSFALLWHLAALRCKDFLEIS